MTHRSITRSAQFLFCGIVLCLTAAGYHAARPSGDATIVPLKAHLDTLPRTLGPWRGRDAELDDSALRILAADELINREYSRGDGRAAFVNVTYYGSPYFRWFHSPLKCYDLGGWNELARRPADIAVDSGTISLAYRPLRTDTDFERSRWTINHHLANTRR